MTIDTETNPGPKPGGDPAINKSVHEIRITNQTMYLHPPLAEGRCKLLEQLLAWEAIVTSQPRIQSSRFQVKFNVF